MSTHTFQEFDAWGRFTVDSLHVKTVYIDMAGDLMAGIMLSEIIYWHLPCEDAEFNLPVSREGSRWLVRSYSSWWDHIRFTEDQARRALTLLKKAGLVETRIWRFDGSPTMHIRLGDRFLEVLDNHLTSNTKEN